MPCMKTAVEKLFGKDLLKLDNTIKRRIEQMSEDVLSQTVLNITNFKLFAIQLDEATNIGNIAQLCVFVRYIKENAFENEFLFCEPLEIRTTAG